MPPTVEPTPDPAGTPRQDRVARRSVGGDHGGRGHRGSRSPTRSRPCSTTPPSPRSGWTGSRWGSRCRPGRPADGALGSPGPRHPGAVGDHAPQGGGGRGPWPSSRRWPTRLGAVNCVIDGDGGLARRQHRRCRLRGRPGPRATGSTRRDSGAWWSGAGGAARAVVAALADAGPARWWWSTARPSGRRPPRPWPVRPDGWAPRRMPRSCRAGGQRHPGRHGRRWTDRPPWPLDPGLLGARPGGGGPRLPPGGRPRGWRRPGPGGGGVQRPRHAGPPGCPAGRAVDRARPRRSEAMWRAVPVGPGSPTPAPGGATEQPGSL